MQVTPDWSEMHQAVYLSCRLLVADTPEISNSSDFSVAEVLTSRTKNSSSYRFFFCVYPLHFMFCIYLLCSPSLYFILIIQLLFSSFTVIYIVFLNWLLLNYYWKLIPLYCTIDFNLLNNVNLYVHTEMNLLLELASILDYFTDNNPKADLSYVVEKNIWTRKTMGDI